MLLEASDPNELKPWHIHTFFPPSNICTATQLLVLTVDWIQDTQRYPKQSQNSTAKEATWFRWTAMWKNAALTWCETCPDRDTNKTLKLPLINRAWLRSQQTWSSPLVSASSIMIQSLSLGKNMLGPWVSKNSSQNHTCNPEPGSCTTQNWEIHDNKLQAKALGLTVVAQNQQRRSQILWVENQSLPVESKHKHSDSIHKDPRHPLLCHPNLMLDGFRYVTNDSQAVGAVVHGGWMGDGSHANLHPLQSLLACLCWA